MNGVSDTLSVLPDPTSPVGNWAESSSSQVRFSLVPCPFPFFFFGGFFGTFSFECRQLKSEGREFVR